MGTVVSQSAPSYRFGGRVLRAAKVSVGVQSTLLAAWRLPSLRLRADGPPARCAVRRCRSRCLPKPAEPVAKVQFLNVFRPWRGRARRAPSKSDSAKRRISGHTGPDGLGSARAFPSTHEETNERHQRVERKGHHEANRDQWKC